MRQLRDGFPVRSTGCACIRPGRCYFSCNRLARIVGIHLAESRHGPRARRRDWDDDWVRRGLCSVRRCNLGAMRHFLHQDAARRPDPPTLASRLGKVGGFFDSAAVRLADLAYPLVKGTLPRATLQWVVRGSLALAALMVIQSVVNTAVTLGFVFLAVYLYASRERTSGSGEDGADGPKRCARRPCASGFPSSPLIPAIPCRHGRQEPGPGNRRSKPAGDGDIVDVRFRD